MASISTDPTTSSLQQILSSTSSPGAKSTTTDFNMFLKLLTTQMQNQDPLSPMDSTQYTQQLVQYSQVEQSVQQNSTLKDILASLSNQTIGQAAQFIGRDAVFESAVSGLGAKPASWQYAADRTMASGTVTIRDAGGKTVFTAPLDVSPTTSPTSTRSATRARTHSSDRWFRAARARRPIRRAESPRSRTRSSPNRAF
ncbi:flagellar hook assembly protein FlgD [Sphingomonas aurantiaca]